jgi:hypothetical protein
MGEQSSTHVHVNYKRVDFPKFEAGQQVSKNYIIIISILTLDNKSLTLDIIKV